MTVAPVELERDDGVVLRGERRGSGADWLVLAHDVGRDLDDWAPLVGEAVRRGLTALTLDLRGHGGSDDPWSAEACPGDLAAAVAFARHSGAGAVALVAAGAAAAAALHAAALCEPDALLLFSPAPVTEQEVRELRGPGIAKLIAVGALDEELDEAARRLQAASIGPALLLSLPTTEQGASLLAGEWRVQAIEQALAFWDEQRYLASAPSIASYRGLPES